MSFRTTELTVIRAGSIIKSGKAWHRQQKLLERLQKPKGKR